MKIPYNRAHISGKELFYISQAVLKGEIKGDGPFTKKCHDWIEKRLSASKVLLTTSCTSALDMASILCDIKEGDEVILPSFTFVSTANAFFLRGAKPIFVDIREDTLNIDENKIERLITNKTKAICPVHYSGVACNMNKIIELAKAYNLFVIEDAAQGFLAKYQDKHLGTLGDIGTFSFHETKNLSSGEGGAIVLNNPGFIERAEVIREKGTNRSKFFRGEVDKYTWIDIGSSFLPSEIISAFLYAQLENSDLINERRLQIWDYYYIKLQELSNTGYFKLPTIPEDCQHTGHIFYLITRTASERNNLLKYLRDRGMGAVFHFIPLHLSPMGRSLGYKPNDLPTTEQFSERLIRLPSFYDLKQEQQDTIIDHIKSFYNET